MTSASTTVRRSQTVWRTNHVNTLYTDQVSSAETPLRNKTNQSGNVCDFSYFLISFFFCIFLVAVSKIMEVYLNSSGPVQALKGERLVLNCTATGELNTRVNISWDYPGKVRPTFQSLQTL